MPIYRIDGRCRLNVRLHPGRDAFDRLDRPFKAHYRLSPIIDRTRYVLDFSPIRDRAYRRNYDYRPLINTIYRNHCR
jgi:hypothetical protein